MKRNIDNIHSLISTGGDTMDASVAYMISDNLIQLEAFIDDLVLESSPYEREAYGWYNTPEWREAMTDSIHIGIIQKIRKHYSACKTDEAEIDACVRQDMERINEYDHNFANYLERNGYSYLGKGSIGIAEKLDAIQGAWYEKLDIELIVKSAIKEERNRIWEENQSLGEDSRHGSALLALEIREYIDKMRAEDTRFASFFEDYGYSYLAAENQY